MEWQINWSAGQLLRQQMLQRFQQGIAEQFCELSARGISFPYGIISMEVVERALPGHQVELSRLEVILPSGVTFRLGSDPGGTLSLNFRKAYAEQRGGITVVLAIPRWRDIGANNVVESEVSRGEPMRHRVVRKLCNDSTDGTDPTELEFLALNARLGILGEVNPSQFETFALMRIVHGESDVPKVDKDFVPATLWIDAAPALVERVRWVRNEAQKLAVQIGDRLAPGRFNWTSVKGLQFENILRLGVLNRHVASLSAFLPPPADQPTKAQPPKVSPFQVHAVMRQLLAELCALEPAAITEMQPYHHEDPLPCFEELRYKIEQRLKPKQLRMPITIAFTRITETRYECDVQVEDLDRGEQFFLGLKTELGGAAFNDLRTAWEARERFCLLPASRAADRMRVFGLPLKVTQIDDSPDFVSEPGHRLLRILHRDVEVPAEGAGGNPDPGGAAQWAVLRRDKKLILKLLPADVQQMRISQLVLYIVPPETHSATR